MYENTNLKGEKRNDLPIGSFDCQGCCILGILDGVTGFFMAYSWNFNVNDKN